MLYHLRTVKLSKGDHKLQNSKVVFKSIYCRQRREIKGWGLGDFKIDILSFKLESKNMVYCSGADTSMEDASLDSEDRKLTEYEIFQSLQVNIFKEIVL